MVAVVVKFALGQNTRWQAERIADVFTVLLKKRSGLFHHVDYLGDYESGEYTGIVYWKTKAGAEESVRTFFPLLKEMLQYECKYPPTLELLDVYTPKEIDTNIDVAKFHPRS